MLFELRQYHIRPGKQAEWVELMENEIIPFQSSQGMVILGSFTQEDDESVYIWVRRFRDEEERKAQYAAVYESDTWKNEIGPKIPALMDREQIKVRRLIPTPHSAIQ